MALALSLLPVLYTIITCTAQPIYFTLGNNTAITYTTNNTEFKLTELGEHGFPTFGVRPNIACRTDLVACCRTSDTGSGGVGEWRYPNGDMLKNSASSSDEGFYFIRNAPQLIRLSRKENMDALSPVGSYCCTVPTTGGDMTLCANLVVCLSLDLKPLTNGAVTHVDQGVGGVANYSCNPGYTLVGDDTRTCMSNGTWNGTIPTCQEIPTNCSDLSSPSDGSVVIVGNIATYSCNTGYELVGIGSSGERICDNGSWTGTEPTCDVVHCDSLANPDDGMVVTPGGTMFGSTALYSCNTGYNLTGAANRTCGDDGQWTQTAPSCQIVDCGSTELREPNNGIVDIPSTTYQSIVEYSCNTGYNLNGTTSRTCGADGKWSEVAPTCTIVDCGLADLTNPINGSFSFSTTTYNSTAVFSCNLGYTLTGESTRTCGADGVWTGITPTCPIIDCGAVVLSVPTNGFVTFESTTYSSNATYSCATGYVLNGEDIRMCGADGLWTGATPTCQEIPHFCGEAPDIPNASHGNPSDSGVGSSVTYTCDPGFILSHAAAATTTISCATTGMWGQLPTCQVPPSIYISQAEEYVTSLAPIQLSTLRESGLVCHTNLPGCCRALDTGSNSLGQWHDPDSNAIESTGEALYVTRGQQTITLGYGGGSARGGVYCCIVPTTSKLEHFCVTIESESTDTTTIIVGGALGGVLLITIIVGLMAIVILVIRNRRMHKQDFRSGFSDITMSTVIPSYTITESAQYEEIPVNASAGKKLDRPRLDSPAPPRPSQTPLAQLEGSYAYVDETKPRASFQGRSTSQVTTGDPYLIPVASRARYESPQQVARNEDTRVASSDLNTSVDETIPTQSQVGATNTEHLAAPREPCADLNASGQGETEGASAPYVNMSEEPKYSAPRVRPSESRVQLLGSVEQDDETYVNELEQRPKDRERMLTASGFAYNVNKAYVVVNQSAN